MHQERDCLTLSINLTKRTPLCSQIKTFCFLVHVSQKNIVTLKEFKQILLSGYCWLFAFEAFNWHVKAKDKTPALINVLVFIQNRIPAIRAMAFVLQLKSTSLGWFTFYRVVKSKEGTFQGILVIFMVIFDSTMQKAPIKFKSCFTQGIAMQGVYPTWYSSPCNSWKIWIFYFPTTYINHWTEGAEYHLFSSPLERKEHTYSAWGTWKVHGHASRGQCSVLKEIHTVVSFRFSTAFFLTGCALGLSLYHQKELGDDLCSPQFPKYGGGCIVAKVNFWGVCETCSSWILLSTRNCHVVWWSAHQIFPLEAD